MAVARQIQPERSAVAAPQLSTGTFVLVCALAIGFCAAVPWISLVGRAGDPSGGYLPSGPVALLALVCWVVAPLIRRWSRNSERLVRAGLLFYALTVSLAGFATTFTVMQIPQVIASLKYFASPINRFEEDAIPAIAETLIITNPVVARGFFEGARSGGVPWEFWRGPLVRWGVLAFLYLVTSVGMLGIFRRRWIDHERLAFPLAEIPLFIAGHGQFGMSGAAARRVWLIVLGVGIGGLMENLNSLHGYVPAVPAIPFNFDISPLFEKAPWSVIAGGSQARLWIDLPLIGIAYLMPSGIALGIFTFFILMVGIMIFSRFLGDPKLGPLLWNPWDSQKQIQGGAYVGLLLFVFWAARGDIARMLGDLLQDMRRGPAAGRHPDRGMLIAFVLGLLAIGLWCVSAGISFGIAITFMLATLALTFGFAMLTAQSGLPLLQVDNLPAQFLTAFAPARAIGLRNLTLIGFFNTIFSWYKTFALQPQAIHGLKIADSEGFRDRRFITALLVAGIAVVAINSATMVHLAYTRNIMLRTTSYIQAFTGNMNAPYYGVLWGLQVNEASPPISFHWMLLGAGLMWGLQLMYRQFMWWPIHPLGMLIPCGWKVTTQWFSVLIGWAVARLVTKYSGPRSYIFLRPVFLGMVLGAPLTQALWMVIRLIFGAPV